MKTKTITLASLLLGSFLSIPMLHAQSLQWAKSFYGQGSGGEAITVDASGNVYSTGNILNVTDMDPGSGTYTLTSSFQDNYISKLDANGNFLWAKQIATGGGANSIKTDAAGNVFLTGALQGTVDLDPGAGTFNVTSTGGQDIFIVKLDQSGNFLWGTSMGSAAHDYGYDLAFDAASNVYAVGTYSGTVDFDPGAGVFNLTSPAGGSSYILKLDNTGNFIWAKTFQAGTYAVAVDAAGIYMTGNYSGTVDFDPGAGTFTSTAIGGSADIFISKLDAAGNFAWAKTMGAPVLADYGNDISVDATGNVIVAGRYAGQVDFDPGAGTYTMTTVGAEDAFALKLDNAGNFIWAKGWGGVNQENTSDLSVDAAGNVFITGFFSTNVDFDPGAGTYTLVTTPYNTNDGFLLKLDASGNFVSAAKFGSNSYDYTNGVANNAAGDVFITGSFVNTVDFDPGVGVTNLVAPTVNAFVVKLGNALPTGITKNKGLNSVSAYPNPFRDNVIFELENNGNETSVMIFNAIGQIVRSGKSTDSKIIIERKGLSTGVYFYKAVQEGNVIASGKLIAE